jgi:uncharacterized protein DUF6166
MPRRYVGTRLAAGPAVAIVDAAGRRALPSRSQHSWSSFTWGRSGVLARELAWALLNDSTGDTCLADAWSADFSSQIVAHLPHEGFELFSEDIVSWTNVCCSARSPVAGQARTSELRTSRKSGAESVEVV